MLKDAEANKDADKKKRESVDVRNQAYTLIHSNEKNLKELSNITNGYYFREENLFELPEIASIEPSKIKLRREADLWSSPLYLILLLIPITLEWFMRKFAELK